MLYWTAHRFEVECVKDQVIKSVEFVSVNVTEDLRIKSVEFVSVIVNIGSLLSSLFSHHLWICELRH